MSLTLSQFDYHLPDSLIAQEPSVPRDSARLMVIDRQTSDISDHYFYELPDLLPNEYDIIANNTKVFPARILGRKSTGGKVEVLLLKKLDNSRYECITAPGLKTDTQVEFDSGLSAIVKNREDRLTTLEFSLPEPDLTSILASIGSMPTPPYIKKMLQDPDEYQTVYAKYGFSAAAPTAGLHFTSELIAKLQQTHAWNEVTLNVGLGTFLPVKEEEITSHHMHTEDYTISRQTAESIGATKASGRKILAIGTTTVRCLEASLGKESTDSTDIFIYPPYKYRVVDALLTNFHLPKSTLLMLVSALVCAPNTGDKFNSFAESLIGRAYTHAVEEKYRFFSFGDAMLIL